MPWPRCFEPVVTVSEPSRPSRMANLGDSVCDGTILRFPPGAELFSRVQPPVRNTG